jgi:hypothetical protein
MILNEGLKESSILVFLDQSAHHKDLLDVDLKERTEKDLKKDIKRMRELMKKQKNEVIEMTQKQGQAAAYKSHETLANAKTRKIEYMYDLSRDPVSLMKEKQQKEMEHMMNFQLALQAIKKQREDFLSNKHEYLVGEQNYKEVVFEYNKKILDRKKELREMQMKINRESKAYHVERTRKQNKLERQKMIDKLTYIDNRAKQVKEDRTDYMASRKYMVQKLKKDLEKMKAGLLTMDDVEKRYAYLHNDKEFQVMMLEIRKEIHPGR